MYAEERQHAMAQLVAERGRLSVADLATAYDVTTETVRRDLSALERLGLLRRVHGGAVPAHALTNLEPGILERDRVNIEAKDRIAELRDELNLINGCTIEQGKAFAAAAPGGTSLKAFQDVMPLWTKGGALEIEVKEQTDERFTFNVVRCRYAETYKAMGLGEIGHLLSCNRDGAFSEGYDPKLKLDRPQTIMQGASHCNFRYTYRK